ncbi:hypothetical protein HHI36_015359 [Cryptolaemus montrouzieri]|uniref:Uncharacterized protein n=1 Tax=Cryptolaemus montrouzieri TaxID=559131 RepID=A0ABD2N6J8_9CUCU
MDVNSDYLKVDLEKEGTKPSSDFKRTSFLCKIRRHFKSYCNHTSIHGFQYLGQNRTVFERCWWIIIFLCTVSACGYVIYLVYNKWWMTPVIVSLTTRDTPIYKVPFPAVTICPTIKFKSKKINYSNFLKKLAEGEIRNISVFEEEQYRLLDYMLPLCKPSLLPPFLMHESPTYTNEIYEAFLNYSPYVKNLRHSAKFMEEELDFYSSFNPVLTDDGLCFSFNMLSTKDIYTDKMFIPDGYNTSGPKSYWIPQFGYSHKAAIETYPRRAMFSGAVNSLEIILAHRKTDIDFKCTGAEQGYKVILHLPTRVPRPTLEYDMAPFGKASVITVTPNMMTTSDPVKYYRPIDRDCFFQGEKNLKFFKIYSKTNCALECLTNYTLEQCGCVAFFMPREASTPICGLSKLTCLDYARKKYNLDNLESKLKESKKLQMSSEKINSTGQNLTESTPKPRVKRSKDAFHNDGKHSNARCYCLRSCNDITYGSSSASVDYEWKQESIFGLLEAELEKNIDFSLISVYLDSNVIFTTERNELYGPLDFLSNFGGLLGLFTGFSILSFMEILYFCSLRILGNRRLLGRWYGDIDE